MIWLEVMDVVFDVVLVVLISVMWIAYQDTRRRLDNVEDIGRHAAGRTPSGEYVDVVYAAGDTPRIDYNAPFPQATEPEP